jgi:hypothetical protein
MQKGCLSPLPAARLSRRMAGGRRNGRLVACLGLRLPRAETPITSSPHHGRWEDGLFTLTLALQLALTHDRVTKLSSHLRSFSFFPTYTTLAPHSIETFCFHALADTCLPESSCTPEYCLADLTCEQFCVIDHLRQPCLGTLDSGNIGPRLPQGFESQLPIT